MDAFHPLIGMETPFLVMSGVGPGMNDIIVTLYPPSQCT